MDGGVGGHIIHEFKGTKVRKYFLRKYNCTRIRVHVRANRLRDRSPSRRAAEDAKSAIQSALCLLEKRESHQNRPRGTPRRTRSHASRHERSRDDVRARARARRRVSAHVAMRGNACDGVYRAGDSDGSRAFREGKGRFGLRFSRPPRLAATANGRAVCLRVRVRVYAYSCTFVESTFVLSYP